MSKRYRRPTETRSKRTILVGAAVFFVIVAIASPLLFGCVMSYWILCAAALICLAAVVVHIHQKQKEEEQKINRYSASYYKRMPEPVAQEELRFMKNIQWSVMYYVLALMGALFVLSNSMTARWSAISGKKITIFAVSLAASVYGIYTILNIMVGLRNTRIGISRTDAYRQKYAARYDEYEWDRTHDSRLFRDFDYHLPFFISILAIQALIFYKVWPWFHIIVNRILR